MVITVITDVIWKDCNMEHGRMVITEEHGRMVITDGIRTVITDRTWKDDYGRWNMEGRS